MRKRRNDMAKGRFSVLADEMDDIRKELRIQFLRMAQMQQQLDMVSSLQAKSLKTGRQKSVLKTES